MTSWIVLAPLPAMVTRVRGDMQLLTLNSARYVRIDPGDFRPAEVDELCDDASRARAILEWDPRTRCGSSWSTISGGRHRTGARPGVERHSADRPAR
jgi:hypothetical protein